MPELALGLDLLLQPVCSTQFYITINDTDLCEDADQVSEFSIITNTDLTKLDKDEF